MELKGKIVLGVIGASLLWLGHLQPPIPQLTEGQIQEEKARKETQKWLEEMHSKCEEILDKRRIDLTIRETLHLKQFCEEEQTAPGLIETDINK